MVIISPIVMFPPNNGHNFPHGYVPGFELLEDMIS